MLAGARSFFPSSFSTSVLLPVILIALLAACLPAQAQVNGVPASVTSFGFGGHTNPNPGVRASVTSLGPNGYGNIWPAFGGCCANFFLPQSGAYPGFGTRHHRRHHDADYFPIGISEPVYVPVPYAVAADDDEPEDADYERTARHALPRPPDKRAVDRETYVEADDTAKLSLPKPAEPVVAQLTTVLVFKDGHKSDVLNYAIVDDTLFDLEPGRARRILLTDLDLTATRKANDDRGVDFQVPATDRKQ